MDVSVITNLVHSARITLRTHNGGRIDIGSYRILANVCHDICQEVNTRDMHVVCHRLEELARLLYGRDCSEEAADDVRRLIEMLFDELIQDVGERRTRF